MDELINPAQEDTLEQVLLVDDNPVNLRVLYRTLKNFGYKLLVAEDGESALEIAITSKPSLILLDIIMPGMDGFQVCQTLKSNAETAGIAVIFLSALEDSSSKVKGFSLGAVDYISKPFQADEVVARVRNHIKIHRLERHLAKRNIELASENYSILAAVEEAIIGLDSEGRITQMNPAAVDISGWSVADCLGERLSTLGIFNTEPGQQVPEEKTLPFRSYRLRQSTRSEMELIRRKNQSLLPVSMITNPRIEGGAVVVIRDISDWVASEEYMRIAREELESQRQHIAHMERLSSTGEMVAGIAHEVNQPLTAIVNYSRVAYRMLEQPQLDKVKLQDLIEKLDMQSTRASEVIQRVRGYLRKPAGVSAEVDINALIRDVIALAEVDSRINDVAVDLIPHKNMPSLDLDVVQIQQVVLNLIRNAMESIAKSEQLQQVVLVKTGLNEGAHISVEVIDGGIGVEKDAESRLFDPFYSTKSNGMGVGLSVCQSIISAHGGDISFRRNSRQGATFYFTLPLK